MRVLSLALAVTFVAAPALAGQGVTLRPDTVDLDGTVTLGELFDGAGAAAGVPVATRTGATVVLDARVVQNLARRNGLDWANAEGLSRIVVRGAPSPSAATARRGNVEVLTYARSLAAGEVVQPSDVVWTKAAGAPGDAPSDADQVIGLAAKRPLRQGAVVSIRDISAPIVIKAGELVTVTYESDGVILTLQGKAGASAAVGDVIAVQNMSSKKIIQAVATGPGQAVVGPRADRIRSEPRSQIALR